MLFKKGGKPYNKRFRAWQVEVTTRCPAFCSMCIKAGYRDLYRKDMGISEFKMILPYLNEVEYVVLEGWGESLLHPRLLDFISLAKPSGAEVGFVTSGAGFDQHYITELIRAGLDFIGFSLAGAKPETHNAIRPGSDFDTLIGSIRLFKEISLKKKLHCPKMRIVYLMLKNNVEDIPPLIELANDIGVKEVALINIIQVTTPWQDHQRIFSCASSTSSKTSDNLSNLNYIFTKAIKKARRFKIKLRLPSPVAEEVAVCADDPLRNIYISVEGEVSPCVFLNPPVPSPFTRIFCGEEYLVEKISFGNILKEPFETIWNNKDYVEFRDTFKKRKEKAEELYNSLFTMKFPGELPLPPSPCRTCHKILGV